MPCRDVSGNVACPCDCVKIEILGEAREAQDTRAIHMWVVLGLYSAFLAGIWIMEIVGKGLERSTSEEIENKWGTPLCVVTKRLITNGSLTSLQECSTII